jgi:hypothetical protein
MSSYTGLSPKQPNRYVGKNLYLSSVVTRTRRPTGADYRQPENGKLYPTASFWLIGPEPTTGAQGELWYLSKIVGNVAFWEMIAAGGSGPLINITVPLGVSPIVPTSLGTINFTSTGGTIAITGSTANPNNNNINFDLTGGGVAIESLTVQAATSPGVSPVVPTTGTITINGAAVANHSVVIESRSRALHALNLEVQYAGSAATTTANLSGVAHFNNTEFVVDASGFVSLLGGGPSIEKVAVQTGTSPVVPSSGQITINGAVVAAGTHPVRSDGTDANTVAIEVQTSQALAASDATKIGLSNFSSVDFTVDANGFVQTVAASPATGVKNLGISYSAGTFTVISQTGAALSAGNPAFVAVPSRSAPGLYTTFLVTANQSFTDSAGSNQIGNSLFGLTTAIAYAQDLPFYIYFAGDNTDANGTFFISRVPNRTICPVAGKIGQSGNTLASTQGSFFAMQAVTAANFAGQPCLCVGAFRMRYTGSSWTVQTLSDGSASTGTNLQADGIGCFHEGSKFQVAAGQFGAAAGSYFLNNGSTAPAWSLQAMSFNLFKNGFIQCTINCGTSTAGSGGGFAGIALPLLNMDTNGSPGTFTFTNGLGVFSSINSNAQIFLPAITSVPSYVTLTNAQMAVSAFSGTFQYQADAS